MTQTNIFETAVWMGMLIIVALVGMTFLAGVSSTGKEAVQVQVGQHAVDQHAKDALRSRLAVFNCNLAYLEVLVHDPIVDNPASRGKLLFVCPDTTAVMCAGMVVGDTALINGAYPEITAFVSTCGYWLSTVPPRDGYTRAEVVAVEKALLGLTAMREVER